MNIKELIDLSDKKTRKFFMMTIYTLIAFLILYFFFRKRTPPARAPQAIKTVKKEDSRPRISISGQLIIPRTLRTLSKIGKFCRIHLIFKVSNNDEENSIKDLLKDLANISQHRILFCETEIGYKATVRQLNPSLHIEHNLQYAQDMSGYLNAIAVVTDQECEQFYQIIEFQDCEGMIVNILNDLH